MAQMQVPERKTLFKDPTFSDITIRQINKGQVKDYAAHKAVLCANSQWFMTALTGRFKDASESTIYVNGDDPKIFQAIMEFFYDLKLKPNLIATGSAAYLSEKHKLLLIIAHYTMADKYDANLLQRALTDAFIGMTADITCAMKLCQVKQLIDAHYPFCTKVLSPMSEAIVKIILKNGSMHLRGTGLDPLIMQYGNFGADLLLCAKRSTKLMMDSGYGDAK